MASDPLDLAKEKGDLHGSGRGCVRAMDSVALDSLPVVTANGPSRRLLWVSGPHQVAQTLDGIVALF